MDMTKNSFGYYEARIELCEHANNSGNSVADPMPEYDIVGIVNFISTALDHAVTNFWASLSTRVSANKPGVLIFEFNNEQLDNVEFYIKDIFIGCNILSKIESLDVANISLDMFEMKNDTRGNIWSVSGLSGMITHIHGKVARIVTATARLDDDLDDDSYIDSIVDLYNYCIFALVCKRNGWIIPSQNIKLIHNINISRSI